MTDPLLLQTEATFVSSDDVRQIVRDALPWAKKAAEYTSSKIDDRVLSIVEAFVESDRLWSYFAGLLGDAPVRAISLRAMVDDGEPPAEIREAASEANVSVGTLIELLPLAIDAAKLLAQFFRGRRG